MHGVFRRQSQRFGALETIGVFFVQCQDFIAVAVDEIFFYGIGKSGLCLDLLVLDDLYCMEQLLLFRKYGSLLHGGLPPFLFS